MSSLEQAAPKDKQTVERRRYGSFIAQFGMVWAFIILVIVGSIVYPRLTSPTNVTNILSQNAPVGIVAVGMTFVMIGGGFDLSVGSTFALATCIFAKLADSAGLWLAALAALAAGALCGTVNGFIVTKLKVNPFVATLGTGSAFGGIAYIYSKSAPITPDNPAFQTVGTGSLLGLPYSIGLLAAIFAVGGFVLAKSSYGQAIYAIGGNNEAARLSGLPTDLLRASTLRAYRHMCQRRRDHHRLAPRRRTSRHGQHRSARHDCGSGDRGNIAPGRRRRDVAHIDRPFGPRHPHQHLRLTRHQL
jgi:ribose transport system permease protein